MATRIHTRIASGALKAGRNHSVASRARNRRCPHREGHPRVGRGDRHAAESNDKSLLHMITPFLPTWRHSQKASPTPSAGGLGKVGGAQLDALTAEVMVGVSAVEVVIT